MNAVRRLPLLILIAAGLTTAPQARAQTSVATTPVGYLQTSCLQASDTYLSIPFFRPPEFVSTVSSVAGNVITLTGSSLTTNQFVYVPGTQPKTYFALLGQNNGATQARDGAMYTITANTANTLTVYLNGDSISAVPSGTQVQVVPYWTLNTLFPASSSGTSFTPSNSVLALQTQILIPDLTGTGINLGAPQDFYFYQSAWRLSGTVPTLDYGDTTIAPDSYIIVRNPANAPTLPLTVMGSVHTGNQQLWLSTASSGKGQDNAVGLIRPVDTPLSSLGLSPSAGNFTASPNVLNIADQLLVYDNTKAVLNKAASNAYYYYNSGWRLSGTDPTLDYGSAVIPAGTGITVRKAVASGTSVLWTNAPTY